MAKQADSNETNEFDPTKLLQIIEALGPDLKAVWSAALEELLKQLTQKQEKFSSSMDQADFIKAVDCLVKLKAFVPTYELAKAVGLPCSVIEGWAKGEGDLPERDAKQGQLMTLYRAMKRILNEKQTLTINLKD